MTVGFGIMFSVWEKQMAQKLLKRMPRKVAPKKSQVEETGRAACPHAAVLVGSILGSDSMSAIVNTTKDEPI